MVAARESRGNTYHDTAIEDAADDSCTGACGLWQRYALCM